MSHRNIGQYESPNIVIVPSKSQNVDPSTENNVSASCKLPCCEYFAAQGNFEHSGTMSSNMYSNNLNYFNTLPDNYLNEDIDTPQPNNFYVNVPPWVSQYESVHDTTYNLQTNVQQFKPIPLYPYQDYSYAMINTFQGTCTCNCTNNNPYIYNTNSVQTYQQGNNGNSEHMPKKDEKNQTIENDLLKPHNDYDEYKEETKKLKLEKRLKSLWKHHSKKLKDKLNDDIKHSEEMKTELHSEWQEILKSEYKIFVNNFYKSACVKRKRNKSSSTDISKKSNLNKKSSIEIKNKDSIPNNKDSIPNNHNTKINNDDYTEVNRNDRQLKQKTIESKSSANKYTSSVKSVVQAPKTTSSRNYHIKSSDDNVDLRTILKLKQANTPSYVSPKTAQKRPSEKENLIITINQDTETKNNKIAEPMEPEPKRQCKKIKLVINVVCEGSDDDSDNNASDHSSLLNPDLSFLDDFNVDDIVDSLNCNLSPRKEKFGTKGNSTDADINSELHKDESKNKEQNPEYLNVNSEARIESKLCEGTLHGNFEYRSSINIVNTNKIKNSTVDTEIQNSSNELLGNMNVKTEKEFMDSNTRIYSDKRLLKENSNTVNYFEKNTNPLPTDSRMLEDNNNIKNLNVKSQMLTENVDVIKSENNSCISFEKTNREETTATLDNINAEECNIKPEYDSKSTNILISDTQKCDTNIITKLDVERHQKVLNNDELVQIKVEDEVIVISDTEDSDEISIANIEDTQNIEKGNNKNSDNIIVPVKQTTAINLSTNENASNEIKELIIVDQIVCQEDDIKKQDSIINSLPENTHPTPTEINSKNKEDEEKSKINSEKKKISDTKQNTYASKSKPNKRDLKEKQLEKTHAKEFAQKLEMYMFEFLHIRYNISSTLHNGKFSKIFKCSNSKGENYVVKVLNNVTHLPVKLSMYKEKMLMKLQKHTPRHKLNIVYLLNSFEFMGYCCFVMEYYPRNLEQALRQNKKCFHINLVQILARQLVAAVSVLTNNHIVHTDIAPRHIFLNSTNEKLKLGGFDESNYLEYLNINPSTGTPSYRAPEIILGFPADYGIDVWSTAAVIFEMATGIKLFPGVYNNDILYKQMCTLGKVSYDMFQKSIFKKSYFTGGSYKRKVGYKGQKVQLIEHFERNNRLHDKLFESYKRDWQSYSTIQEVYQERAKLEDLHLLLMRMLTMDPRYRLSIIFVGASEFIDSMFS